MRMEKNKSKIIGVINEWITILQANCRNCGSLIEIAKTWKRKPQGKKCPNCGIFHSMAYFD